MKKQLFLFILMLLPILASAQTVSDVQNSGCLNEKLGDESQRVPTIVLTKEGSTLSVQLLNYEENCCTEDFNATYSISGGSDSELCSVSINVAPTIEYNCDCICPFNPLLGGKNITIATGIESNVTEFRNIKIGVINLLPYSQEFDRIACTKPM